jgi:hypothetical protein
MLSVYGNRHCLAYSGRILPIRVINVLASLDKIPHLHLSFNRVQEMAA